MNVINCDGNGQGSCKRCLDQGKWNRMWICFLSHIEGKENIEGYDGCYCNDCVKEILKENMEQEEK